LYHDTDDIDMNIDLTRSTTGEGDYEGAFYGHIFVEDFVYGEDFFIKFPDPEDPEAVLRPWGSVRGVMRKPFYFPANEENITVNLGIKIQPDATPEGLKSHNMYLGEYIIPTLDPFETGAINSGEYYLENQENLYTKELFDSKLLYRVDQNATSSMIILDADLSWQLNIVDPDGNSSPIGNSTLAGYTLELSRSGIRDPEFNLNSVGNIYWMQQKFVRESRALGTFLDEPALTELKTLNVLITFPNDSDEPTGISYDGITAPIQHVTSQIGNDYGDRYIILDLDEPLNTNLGQIIDLVTERGLHEIDLLT